VTFSTILYEEKGPIGHYAEPPDDGNMFTAATCYNKLHDCINAIRRETRTRVIVLTGTFALEIAERGPFALASIKAAFNARHGGVAGLSRMAHDLLLRSYLDSDESHELSAAFAEKRKPDPSKFGK
jgi:1,4-dihydroxy-2-naphthoyl-CoA synthase